MKIVITGPKGSGKSTIGKKISEMLGVSFIETDERIVQLYEKDTGKKSSCREIFTERGESVFRDIESRAVKDISESDWCVISTGGGTMLNPSLQNSLRDNSILILLKADDDFLWKRLTADGLPPFFSDEGGREKHDNRNKKIYESCEHIADIVFIVDAVNESEAHALLLENITTYMHTLMRSANTFGEVIRTTTFGESHGPAVGAVLDGVKPGIEISEKEIQLELDRRKPGQSRVTTQRKEDDAVKILSGVFEGKTTGTPICMLIYNRDQDSSKYEPLRDVFRPGHADFTFWKKYGIRDHRGGGRSSGRETAARVASGAVAKKILSGMGIEIYAYSLEIAGIRGEVEDLSYIEKNAVRSADPIKYSLMEEAVLKARKEKDSVGGIVRLIVKNAPAGIGDPVFYKLDARLGMAYFSIGAVKGVEFGSGFESARMTGSTNNDPITGSGFSSNNSGGILGGISNGDDIIANIAVKPTPSIQQEQSTVDVNGTERKISIEGRHDPCIVPRIIPVIDSMTALVLLDAIEINERMKR